MRIEIKNEEIINFYEKHPNLDIETINLYFIDIIKKLSTNLNSTMNENNISQILKLVGDMNKSMEKLDTGFSYKVMEMKSAYVKEVEQILEMKNMTEKEEMVRVLERNHDNMVMKTELLMKEILPQSVEGYEKIEKSLKGYFSEIDMSTKRLMEGNERKEERKEEMSNIIGNIDRQFNQMACIINTPISQSLEIIKENVSSTKQIQEEMTGEVNKFLNKYKNNSTAKGNISETELYMVLQSVMGEDEIIRCGGDTATCDIRVNRKDRNKPSILFENKNYARSVDTEEVKKFERDIMLQREHGIFLSQNSPITYKGNFHIDVKDRLIMVYVPNTGNNAEKIKIAIDIVDSLSEYIKEPERETDETAAEGEKVKMKYTIEEEEMKEIIEEYVEFGKKKMRMVELIKEMSGRLITELNEVKMPVLRKYIMGTAEGKKVCKEREEESLECEFCRIYTGTTKGGLTAHKRKCSKNPGKSQKEREKKAKEEGLNIEVNI